MAAELGDRTIGDFGDQWAKYTDNSGFYGSDQLFGDIVSPLVDRKELAGKVVAEIGSGSGRIIGMLCRQNVAKAYAVEPSPAAYEVLVANTEAERARVECLNLPGERLPELGLDYVFSVGVIHHIPEPGPTVAAAFRALKSGGKCFFWLYGKEGNELYLSLVDPMRKLTVRMPHAVLAVLCHLLNLILDGYTFLCRFLPLPLRDYVLNVIGRMSRDKRYLVIYDQLNPAYAKYYTGEEARALLEKAGFMDVRLHHRRGYSWSVVGTKP